MLMERIILIVLLSFMFMSFTGENNLEAPRCDTSFLNSTEINDSILYSALVHYGIKYPTIVLAQAKLETGNYTSYHCRKGNNLFGLYDSRNGRYYKFNHWSKSIIAYKNKVEYKHKKGENYYAFLRRIKYATSPSYIMRVKQIERTL